MDLSIVVVAYDMARELPRTLATLSPAYQRAVDDLNYEVVVVDNGSPAPVSVDPSDPHLRLHRIDDAPPSPVRAANTGIDLAAGSAVGLWIDGARMASPGLIAKAAATLGTGPRVIVATMAMHLGPAPQMQSAANGYDQGAEDELLASIDWAADGYDLFTISVLAGSSLRGWFGPMGETNSLFLGRQLWDELGGLDPAFARPGGGLANHDLFRRACDLPDTTLVVLHGEATFHQFHGGAATSGQASRDELWAEYESIRGVPYEPPARDREYFGAPCPQAMVHLRQSIDWYDRDRTKR